jgi:spore germination protein KC
MKGAKISLAFLFVIAAVFLTAGCWNYRELNTMMIVAGIAFDKGDNGKGYHLSYETLDVSGESGEKQPSIKSLLIESDGETVFDAARNALKRSDKKLYFGACEAVIISDAMAREGIAGLLDWLARDAEPRNTIDIYIAREKTAKEVIMQKSLTDPITSVTIKAALGEMETSVDLATEQGMAETEKAASESVAANICRVIEKARDEYGSDIFGFGSAIYKASPGYWYKIKPEWDSLFKAMEISISARVSIKNTGELIKKVKVQ